MSKLVFEKVGDIQSTYPYLCVYVKGQSAPFMEIAVNDQKLLVFTIYAGKENASLTADEWMSILDRGRAFLPKVVADEIEANVKPPL